ncbi:MAG: ABC transporter substrate-binding protein [Mogibacterium sp.]|nr:ABC transporter substrate-binding protein [Mogibacterium sp.]
MKNVKTKRKLISFISVLMAALLCLQACSSIGGSDTDRAGADEGSLDSSKLLRITSEEPDTGDPQCTEDDYDIALNVFDRLVETKVDADRKTSFEPSLAESWDISDDGLVYTFHLREGVKFSNGAPLTSEDVEYTLIRAITHPDSYSSDIAEFIKGFDELSEGKTEKLEGFKIIDDLDFSITLALPDSAFLAILSIPCASILDKETTTAAGDSFGRDPAVTVGTGPFIFEEWNEGRDLTLTANPDCWAGAPGCDGVKIQFVIDSEAKRMMFENGELDILDLENLGSEAEYFIRGDIYQDRLIYGNRVGLSYIALNESVEPLNDVRVRKALQLGLDREAILMNIFSGRGNIENGVIPHGLLGFDPDLPEIPYDPDTAKELLAEAGYPEGFDLELYVDDETPAFKETLRLAASMWKKIGVRTSLKEISKDRFMEMRSEGNIPCYTGKFSVDYNDPDSIMWIFFGDSENFRARSLCYSRTDIMDRVNDACGIVNEEERIKEYRELEKIIVQEDCAWIPLFSNQHYFVVNERVKNFEVSWNGWTNTKYRDIVIEDKEQ